jgi:hypothetical protein
MFNRLGAETSPAQSPLFSFRPVGFSTLWAFGRRVEFYMVPYKWRLESRLNLVALEPQTGHLTFLSILFSGRLFRLLKSGMNWTVAVTCVKSANADVSELWHVQNDLGCIDACSLCNVQSGSSCSSYLPFYLPFLLFLYTFPGYSLSTILSLHEGVPYALNSTGV